MELLQKMLPSILCEIVRFRFLDLESLPVLPRQTPRQVLTSCRRAAVDAPRTSSPDCGLDGLVWGY